MRSNPKDSESEALGGLANDAAQDAGDADALADSAREEAALGDAAHADDAPIARLFEMTSDLLATISTDGSLQGQAGACGSSARVRGLRRATATPTSASTPPT